MSPDCFDGGLDAGAYGVASIVESKIGVKFFVHLFIQFFKGLATSINDAGLYKHCDDTSTREEVSVSEAQVTSVSTTDTQITFSASSAGYSSENYCLCFVKPDSSLVCTLPFEKLAYNKYA